MAAVLDGAVAYLGGGIDDAPDNGITWRENIKTMLDKRGVKLTVLDPTNKIAGLTGEVGSEKQQQQKMKNEEDWHGLRKFMKKIVRADLRMVDLCDFVIAFIDVEIHLCGTYQEITTADVEHKPVLLIIKGGKKKCPCWLFGTIHYDYMFDSVEDCVDYLVKVNSGDVILDDKWVLIRDGMKKIEIDSFERKQQCSPNKNLKR